MRCQVLAAGALVALCLSVGAHGQPLEADANDLEGLLRTLSAATAKESPLLYQTDGGFVRFIGAPPGGHLESGTAAKAGAESVAKDFIEAHRGAFGLLGAQAGVRTQEVSTAGARTVVRLSQLYGMLPVYGAQMLVQLDANGDVALINSDIAIDLRALDSGAASTTPRIDAATAATKAREYTASRSEDHGIGDLRLTEAPQLMIYAPVVIGRDGPVRLVWCTKVQGLDGGVVLEQVLVDAQSGGEVLSFSLVQEGRNRIIYDLENRTEFPVAPARLENQAPTGIADIDVVYDFLGDVYDFFLTHHEWDNFDGGLQTPPSGFAFMPIFAYVRYPMANAAFFPAGSDSFLLFGTDYNADDVVAHEFTHGVTEYTSRLIYQGYSGAINESFSDIWGEFVDLTNGAGNDSAEVRWNHGEDLPEELHQVPEVPGNRNMKDPTIFGDPDRLNSPLVVPFDSAFDNGGVHFNSGIGNKLCYLLTDGDTFNGQTVAGFGIDTTADLYWECQNILTPGADYFDLYLALMAGSVNLGLSLDDRLNILAACLAVEIVPTDQVASLRATPTLTNEGAAAVALNWTLVNPGQGVDVTLLRSTVRYPVSSIQGEIIYQGIADRYLDTDVLAGVEYFYTLIQDQGAAGIAISFANAVAGLSSLSLLTEAFDADHPIDLTNSQLTFTPVGPPVNSVDEALAATGFERYDVTCERNVTSLPVARSDADGGALSLTFLEDGLLALRLANPMPFFGIPRPTLYLASNGYIAFAPVDRTDTLNFPSLASHFDVPRISFLFGDLDPSAGGQAWLRDMDDRLVVTFEEVPEFTPSSFPSPPGNTVQIELFQNGQVRITYLRLQITDAVIGLSDGAGVPVQPSELFEDVTDTLVFPDLSSLPSISSRLRIDPVFAQSADAGERILFDVQAVAPAGSSVPQFYAEWTGPGIVPVADLGNGTARFDWTPQLEDEGAYTVRFIATLGADLAFLDVPIHVGEVFLEPEAINLQLSTGTPLEDPTQDRNIPPGVPLVASYTYTHPQLEPGNPLDPRAEGMTFLYWRRNNTIVPGLTNRPSVPGGLVQGGDSWSFSVLPIDQLGVIGQEAFSPTVYVLAVPEPLAISPNFGEVNGGDRVTITGSRLSGPLLVTFGGIKADQVFSLGDSKLEVVTPLHIAETVDVVVKTAKGSGTLKNAFTFTPDAAKVPNPDVNGDGVVDALDVQTVINAILSQAKSQLNADVNRDGAINAADMQAVINAAIYR